MNDWKANKRVSEKKEITSSELKIRVIVQLARVRPACEGITPAPLPPVRTRGKWGGGSGQSPSDCSIWVTKPFSSSSYSSMWIYIFTEMTTYRVHLSGLTLISPSLSAHYTSSTWGLLLLSTCLPPLYWPNLFFEWFYLDYDRFGEG